MRSQVTVIGNGSGDSSSGQYRNGWLLTAGILSGIGAAMHLGCIVGGPSWYRFFGAGERMARLSEQGSPEPAIVAAVIAIIVGIWSAYALSGAGLLPRLPLLRPALVLISAIYLIRAAALPIMLVYLVPGRSAEFLIWSSVTVLIFGIVYAVGTWTAWSRLASGR